eukprot:SAG31_NODE_28043_length_416_cov_0.817035_1_plen_100_part_01
MVIVLFVGIFTLKRSETRTEWGHHLSRHSLLLGAIYLVYWRWQRDTVAVRKGWQNVYNDTAAADSTEQPDANGAVAACCFAFVSGGSFRRPHQRSKNNVE